MLKRQLPVMWQRIHRCSFCGEEVETSSLGYAENPFCVGCLNERIGEAAQSTSTLSWRQRGDYLVAIDLAHQKLQ